MDELINEYGVSIFYMVMGAGVIGILIGMYQTVLTVL